MSTIVGNPSFADDLALVAIVPSKLQKRVDIVYRYCRTWPIDVNVTKSATVVYTNIKANHIQTGIMYENTFIEQDDHAIHLGIRHYSNLSLNTKIHERWQKAPNSFFAMAGQGLHPNGIHHALSADLYCKIIIPTVFYGAELWSNMTHCDTNLIRRLHHFIAKQSRAFLPALDQTYANPRWDCITYHATLISWNLTSCTNYLLFHNIVSVNNYLLRNT